MGLIDAVKQGIVTSAGTFAGDQWREYFYCDSLPSDVLVRKGQKKVSEGSANTTGTDNIISNGSIIAVNAGQCMIIVEQGKVVEVCAEPGQFVFDKSTEPTLLYGNLGKNIIDSAKTLLKRFSFGGEVANDQRIYFFNTKEIRDNKFGTAQPIPVRVVDTNIGLDMDISIRCNGQYTYKIVDPILFYTNVCGNITGDFTRTELDSTLKAEFLDKLQPALAKVSAMGIRYSAFPGKTAEIGAAINEELKAEWADTRGIVVGNIAINSVTAPEEDEKAIQELQRMAVMRNPGMAAASLVGAQGDAMRAAASNEGGAMLGFMGMNMAQAAGGFNTNNLFQMDQQNQAQAMMQQQQIQGAAFAQGAQAKPADGWTCKCGTTNTGKFCANCGEAKPADGWTCACGAVNKGKFCTECGQKKPAGEPLYKCDKCGWEPADPKNPPKFCPECGDPFGDEDITNN